MLPFVQQFYGGPYSFLWDDACGNTHDILQGEGGEQGDPLMPALYSLGQHRALEAVARRLLPTERLFAFLDDLYVVCQPGRVVDVHHIVAVELWSHAKIRIQHGKTQVWNRGGIEPPEIETLQAAAQVSDPDALVWRGDTAIPEVEHGMKILGTPLGHPAYVQSFLRAKTEEHALLLGSIPELPDLQSAWLILLFCASSRANYLLRTLPPCVTEEFAASHDESSRACVSNLLDRVLPDDRWELASLPLSLGGLGLRNASRTRPAAHWASWADCLAMVMARHPPVATAIVNALDNHPGLHFQGVRAARERLLEAQFDAPGWEALADGQRPDREGFIEDGPGLPRHGWQCKATRPVDEGFLEGVVRPRLLGAQQALLRSQSGPFASLPFTSFPSAPHTRFDPQPFRVLLLRRLWLQLPSSGRSCRCWPSPRSVRRGGGFESQGIRSGVCRSAGLSGSRRSGQLERQSPGHGSGSAQPSRQSEDLKSWWTGCPCSTAPSLPWTPPWCLHFVGMGLRTPVAMTSAAQPSQQGGARRSLTLSSTGGTAAPDSLSWVLKWAAGGRTKPLPLSRTWPEPRHEGSPQSCEVVPSRRGCTVGLPSLHAVLQKRSHCRCSSAGEARAQMV